MFRFCRSVVRIIKLLALLLYGVLNLLVARPSTRNGQAEWLHRYCALVLHKMGIPVRCEGTFPERGVVITNHIGYLDIVSLASLHPCVFVAKAEMRHWPLLGWMTTAVGSVYVARGRGGSAIRAAQGMREAAEAGVPLVFFPEGTTSNGASLLPFHSGLLVQALEAASPITSGYIRYRLLEDNGPGVSVANDVSYWGKVLLLKHVFRALGLRGIQVDIRFADAPIRFSTDTSQRKLLAAEAREAVMDVGGVRDSVIVD